VLTGSLEFSKHYGKYPTLAIVLVRPLYNSFSVHLVPLAMVWWLVGPSTTMAWVQALWVLSVPEYCDCPATPSLQSYENQEGRKGQQIRIHRLDCK